MFQQVAKKFQGAAIVTNAFLINRIFTNVLESKTLISILLYNKDPFALTPSVFGYVCFVHNNHPNMRKLNLVYFLGYSPTQKYTDVYIHLYKSNMLRKMLTCQKISPTLTRVLLRRSVRSAQEKLRSTIGNKRFNPLTFLALHHLHEFTSKDHACIGKVNQDEKEGGERGCKQGYLFGQVYMRKNQGEYSNDLNPRLDSSLDDSSPLMT